MLHQIILLIVDIRWELFFYVNRTHLLKDAALKTDVKVSESKDNVDAQQYFLYTYTSTLTTSGQSDSRLSSPLGGSSLYFSRYNTGRRDRNNPRGRLLTSCKYKCPYWTLFLHVCSPPPPPNQHWYHKCFYLETVEWLHLSTILKFHLIVQILIYLLWSI